MSNDRKVVGRRGLRRLVMSGYVYATMVSVYGAGDDVHAFNPSVEHHVAVLSTPFGLSESFSVDHGGYGLSSSLVLADVLALKHCILSSLLGRWAGSYVCYSVKDGRASRRAWVASVIGADRDECDWYEWDGAIGKTDCSPVGVCFDSVRDRECQHDIYRYALKNRVAGRFIRSAVVVRWKVDFIVTAGAVNPAAFLDEARCTDIVAAGFGKMVLKR